MMMYKLRKRLIWALKVKSDQDVALNGRSDLLHPMGRKERSLGIKVSRRGHSVGWEDGHTEAREGTVVRSWQVPRELPCLRENKAPAACTEGTHPKAKAALHR